MSEEILQEPTECSWEIKYLENEGCNSCEIEKVMNGVLFIKNTGKYLCRHKISFGFSHICINPVRIEIYDKFGK